MDNKKWKNKNFFEALKHSLAGIKYTFKNERNLKIQLIFGILATGFGIYFNLTSIEFAVLFLVIGIVFFAEHINTAIEVMLDLYSQDKNEIIKIAKDISSGAVLITSIMSVIIGCILFLPKILNLF